MYRIARLAELLDVSTVKIHEKLILLKSELAPHIHKEHGVTVLTESGLLVLKRAFDADRHATEILMQDEAISADQAQGEDGALSEIDRRELEMLNLKDKINQHRSELHRLNIESRRLDDAIVHYMDQLKEDLDLRIRQEDQVEGMIRHHQQRDAASSQIPFFSSLERK